MANLPPAGDPVDGPVQGAVIERTARGLNAAKRNSGAREGAAVVVYGPDEDGLPPDGRLPRAGPVAYGVFLAGALCFQ